MTPLYHPRPDRWAQFSLRGLLIAVTLAALLMPWAITEYRAWQQLRWLRSHSANPNGPTVSPSLGLLHLPGDSEPLRDDP